MHLRLFLSYARLRRSDMSLPTAQLQHGLLSFDAKEEGAVCEAG